MPTRLIGWAELLVVALFPELEKTLDVFGRHLLGAGLGRELVVRFGALRHKPAFVAPGKVCRVRLLSSWT